jgi:hypothetical protein
MRFLSSESDLLFKPTDMETNINRSQLAGYVLASAVRRILLDHFLPACRRDVPGLWRGMPEK